MKKIVISLLSLAIINVSFAQSSQLYPDSVVISNGTTTNPALRVSNANEDNLFPNIQVDNKAIVGIGVFQKNPIGRSLGVYLFNTEGIGLFSLANGVNGRSAKLEIDNVANNQSVLHTITNGTGNAILSNQKGTNGSAGFFLTENLTNPNASVFAETFGLGNAGHFKINNSASLANAIRIESSGGSNALFSTNTGAGGAGHFLISNLSNTSKGLRSVHQGNGAAAFFQVNNGLSNANAMETQTNGSGNSIYSFNNGVGRAGFFQIFNVLNVSNALESVTNGEGKAIYGLNTGKGSAGDFVINNTVNPNNALSAQTNGISNGIFSEHTGANGSAGYFINNNNLNPLPTLQAISESASGAAIYGLSFNDGSAAIFNHEAPASTSRAVQILTTSDGAALFVDHKGTNNPSISNLAVFQNNGTNVMRVDRSGRGFFNGGTQNSGADIAESFKVEGNKLEYEPGDVLVISTKTDRTIEKSSEAYSSLVAGVYATKPGVLLTENHIDTDLSAEVPMGVVGVIPTKVCNEGGKIQRGDLLVSSSQIGYAMKADPDKIKVGQVLGKALENFDGEQGKIKVLVNVK